MNDTNRTIRLTPEARAALDAAKRAGYTKLAYASRAIVERAEREGLVPRGSTQPKEEGNER